MTLALTIICVLGWIAVAAWTLAPARIERLAIRLGDRINRTPSRRPVPIYRSDLRVEIEAYLRSKEVGL